MVDSNGSWGALAGRWTARSGPATRRTGTWPGHVDVPAEAWVSEPATYAENVVLNSAALVNFPLITGISHDVLGRVWYLVSIGYRADIEKTACRLKMRPILCGIFTD